MFIESIINKIILDIEDIENEFNLLLTEKNTDETTVQLLDIYYSNIKTKIENLISYFYILLKEYENKTIKDCKCDNLICNLMSASLLKIIYKIVLLNNTTSVVKFSTLSKLLDTKDGIIEKIKNLTEFLLLDRENERNK